MDEAEAFFRRFIDTEFAALRATFVEDDDAVAQARVDEAQRFLRNTMDHPLTVGFGRAIHLSPAERAQRREDVAHFIPRTLYLLRTWDHDTRGRIREAVVGSSQAYLEGEYDLRLFAATVDGELRIISRYAFGGLGRPVTWEHSGGEKLDAPGRLVETRKLVPPDAAAQRADWDAA